MIITRSPLRISLGGGGTDLPSYYTNHEGFVISAAIDKYVYVTINRPFTPGIYLKYSELEHVNQISDVKHPIIREALKLLAFELPQIEIASLAEIPAGTGLGSSGSFTTALIKALYAYKKRHIHPKELAELACHVELNLLKEPIGKQDQYASAFGGISCFTFHTDHEVSITPLKISRETILELEDNLLLFFTGFSRRASLILEEQDSRSKKQDKDILNHLHDVKRLGYQCKEALEQGATIQFGELMHEHWEHKKKRSRHMSNSQMNEWYELGLKNGAVGGKVVGAGGGGFLMFMAQDRSKLRRAMKSVGLEEMRIRFDFEGSKMIVSS